MDANTFEKKLIISWYNSFLIEKLRKYMWEHLASCLIGTNSEPDI